LPDAFNPVWGDAWDKAWRESWRMTVGVRHHWTRDTFWEVIQGANETEVWTQFLDGAKRSGWKYRREYGVCDSTPRLPEGWCWYRCRDDLVEAIRTLEREEQAGLLRHIIGNPFRRYDTPHSWPAVLVALAEALYKGKGAWFELHDALEEAGHPHLAEHFRREQWHPKGCWAVDLILGKT
jgi:hypothetical protein